MERWYPGSSAAADEIWGTQRLWVTDVGWMGGRGFPGLKRETWGTRQVTDRTALT